MLLRVVTRPGIGPAHLGLPGLMGTEESKSWSRSNKDTRYQVQVTDNKDKRLKPAHLRTKSNKNLSVKEFSLQHLNTHLTSNYTSIHAHTEIITYTLCVWCTSGHGDHCGCIQTDKTRGPLNYTRSMGFAPIRMGRAHKLTALLFLFFL